MGSRLLIDAADAIRSAIRQCDVPARVGGDEFAVLLVGGRTAAENVVGRLNDVIARTNSASCGPYTLSLSVGTAVSSHGDRHSLSRLLSEADDEMYANKRARRSDRSGSSPGR